MAMRSNYFLSLTAQGFHRVHYLEWGQPDNDEVLLCVHGLTRNGRDFDFLARALENRYRTFCPDIAGRGKSDWLANKTDYAYPQYSIDMTALIARSGARQVDWVGTSMGGLIGLFLAALPQNPIRRLVLNDIGAFIPRAALARIGEYVGKPLRFTDLSEMERHLREIAAPFGPLSDAQWRHLTEHSARKNEEGAYEFSYDPAIGDAFRERKTSDIDLWAVWERVECPVLILRGAESDLLRRQDAERMATRESVEWLEFSGVGHAPALMDERQIAAVRDWLLSD